MKTTAKRSEDRALRRAFGYHDRRTFQRLENLSVALRHLGFQGKSVRGRNLKAASEALDVFEAGFLDHMRREELYLFPYLETHLPKIEPLVALLLAEHEDLRNCVRTFHTLLLRLRQAPRAAPEILEIIRERSTYFSCLLHSHHWAELEMVGKTAQKELKADEKKALTKILRN